MKKLITDIKKLKSGYKVTFNDEAIINIELDIFIKYHLKSGLDLNQATYLEMLKENEKLYYTKLGVIRLKRMQTKKELFDYLVGKGCNFKLANDLVIDFKKKRYIDDDEYAKLFIETKKRQQGPKLLTANLLKKGIDLDIINKHLANIDEYEILGEQVKKKYASYRHKTRKQALLSTKTHFILKGYKRELVDMVLMKVKEEIPKNDQVLLDKAFDKLYDKLKDKKEGYELKSLIKQKLYQKGFEIGDIETIFIQKNVLS